MRSRNVGVGMGGRVLVDLFTNVWDGGIVFDREMGERKDTGKGVDGI